MLELRCAKVLVCFYSRSGDTAGLAEAVAEGARARPGDEVRLRRVPDLEPEEVIRQNERWWRTRQEQLQRYRAPDLADLRWADGLVLGSPGYFGGMAAALKHWLEHTVEPWRRNEIAEKAGAAFCTTATVHGGNETTILSMLTALMHLGFVVVPAGYQYPVLGTNQSPYGASAVTGRDAEIPPTPDDLAAARWLGSRVSHVARCLLVGWGEEEYRRRLPMNPS
jgi:NAD(P)H dehydrogenase (quinone)